MNREEKMLYLGCLSEEADRMLQPVQEHVFSRSFEQRQEEVLSGMLSQEEPVKGDAAIPVKRKTGHLRGKKWLAVLLVAALAVGATVFATRNSTVQVRDLMLDDEIQEPVEEVENYVDENGVEQEVTFVDCNNSIYLTYPDSPEALASQEWYEFMQEHEKTQEYEEAVKYSDELRREMCEEGAEQGEGDVTQLERPNPLYDDLREYEIYADAYGVIDHTMAQKLDEIQETYSVKLLSDFQDLTDYDYDSMTYRNCYPAVLQALSVKTLAVDPEQVSFTSSYTYKDGFFNGTFDIVEYGSLMGSMSAAYKGYLNPFYTNLGDTSQTQEWNYVNASGNEVTLYLSLANESEMIYLFYKGERTFVSMQFIDFDGWTDMTREQAQKLADLFDLSEL